MAFQAIVTEVLVLIAAASSVILAAVSAINSVVIPEIAFITAVVSDATSLGIVFVTRRSIGSRNNMAVERNRVIDAASLAVVFVIITAPAEALQRAAVVSEYVVSRVWVIVRVASDQAFPSAAVCRKLASIITEDVVRETFFTATITVVFIDFSTHDVGLVPDIIVDVDDLFKQVGTVGTVLSVCPEGSHIFNGLLGNFFNRHIANINSRSLLHLSIDG